MDEGAGPRGDEAVDVIRARDAGAAGADELPGVAPDLVRTAHPDADPLEGRVVEDFGSMIIEPTTRFPR